MMGVKIELPKCDGAKTGVGTKVYSDSGSEITGISSIDISIKPDCFITAVIDVELNSVDNMDNIHALLGTNTLDQIAELHGKAFYSKAAEGASIDFKVDASEIEEVCLFMDIVAKYGDELPQAMKDELSELVK